MRVAGALDLGAYEPGVVRVLDVLTLDISLHEVRVRSAILCSLSDMKVCYVYGYIYGMVIVMVRVMVMFMFVFMFMLMVMV